MKCNYFYYAKDLPTKNKEGLYLTQYVLYTPYESIISSIWTRRKLWLLEDVTESDYKKMCASRTPENYFKQKDYEIITEGLNLFGKLIGEGWIKNKIIPNIIYNGGPNSLYTDYRLLKSFEKKAFLISLIEVTGYKHLMNHNHNK